MKKYELKTVSKNEKREVVNICEVGGNRHRYIWVEGDELTIMDVGYQPKDEILELKKDEIESLFVGKTLVKRIMPTWKTNLCKYVDIILQIY